MTAALSREPSVILSAEEYDALVAVVTEAKNTARIAFGCLVDGKLLIALTRLREVLDGIS